MSETILCLLHPEAGTLHRHALECLAAAKQLKTQLGATLVVGCIGNAPTTGIDACEADRYLAVSGDAYTASRYATDIVAAKSLIEAASATVVIAPSSPRTQRYISGLATRVGGVVDTHATAIDGSGEALEISRWYYRQRMEAKITRENARPWLISLESGCYTPIAEAGCPAFEIVDAVAPATRTNVKEIESTSSGDQTILPDADTLFVAGAGWTKKQADGAVQTQKAEALILSFIQKQHASLGSSKSMVDLSAEGQAVLPFLTHLHQIGQTGSTPRHAKGLATCCHGEEPHAVGWRFIKERRAINLDPNCGWAHGKADVLYVADAFEVMEKVTAKLS